MNNVTIDWGLGFQEGYDEGLQKGKETSRMLMVNRVVKLNNKIKLLERENKKLHDLVYRAYQEGFGDAPSKRSESDNSGDDMAKAWEASHARAALKGEK
jgi:hypothetical protein